MFKLKRFDVFEYHKDNILDGILDKMSDKKPLSEWEELYLKGKSTDNKEIISGLKADKEIQKIIKPTNNIYKDENFKFVLNKIENIEEVNAKAYHGKLTLPDGEMYSGMISEDLEDGICTPFFYDGEELIDIYDFVKGLEYEFDDFLHNTVAEINENEE